MEKLTREGMQLEPDFGQIMTQAGQARIILRNQAIEERRANLKQAEDGDDLLRGASLELRNQILQIEYGHPFKGVFSAHITQVRACIDPADYTSLSSPSRPVPGCAIPNPTSQPWDPPLYDLQDSSAHPCWPERTSSTTFIARYQG